MADNERGVVVLIVMEGNLAVKGKPFCFSYFFLGISTTTTQLYIIQSLQLQMSHLFIEVPTLSPLNFVFHDLLFHNLKIKNMRSVENKEEP